jgi:hypothetical protein
VAAGTPAGTTDGGAPTGVGGSGGGGNTATDSVGTVQIGGGNTSTGSTGTVQTGPPSSSPTATVGEPPATGPGPTAGTGPTTTGGGTAVAAAGVLAAEAGGPTATPSAATAGTTVTRSPRGRTEPGLPGTGRTFGTNRELSRASTLAQLPFTGLALWLFVALGLMLLTGGAGIRRYADVR